MPENETRVSPYADTAMSWEEQEEKIREMNSIALTLLYERLDYGGFSDEDVKMFSALSSIAKQWSAENRNRKGDDEDVSKLPDEKLMG